ncbi:MAG: T9SS type A sorting domain-containing protein [Saprospiraceae bacterium]|nr:T9SS type A sorting domain-containing protein [Saprospiraceae bacterium]
MERIIKLKYVVLAAFFLKLFSSTAYGQDQSCNKLGAWLWYLELTKFKDYESLADTLSSLGIKRIYVKVANGRVDTVKWTELVDEKIPAIFEARGIEAWAWSYNYPNNERLQAEALYKSAKSGYKGYVVDVEAQFDRKPVAASKLFRAFDAAKSRAIADDVIDENFQLYCTTWANPRAHYFPISSINQYVDGFMPQTYVENWGNEHLLLLESTIDRVNEEYKSLGATKPLHHIASTEKGLMTANEVNRFITYAGPETSVWPIPGTNTSLLLWHTWNSLAWDFDFCNDDHSTFVSSLKPEPDVKKLPYKNEIVVNEPVSSISIINATGHVVAEVLNPGNVVDISNLVRGKYVMSIITAAGDKVVKMFSKGK